jgi:regulator of chromosome condensation
VTGLGPENDFRVVRAAAGDSISVAISSTGDVKYWGSFRGAEGLLGFGGVKKAIQYEPVDLPFSPGQLRSSAFVSVAAGTDHVLALASDGHVYSMGDNVQGQLGRKVPPRAQLRALTPEPLALKRIRAIGTGAYHSFAIDLDGRVFAWGFNAAGQCGVAPGRVDRSWAEGIVERPTIVDALSPEHHGGARVIKIDAGSDHSLFLFDNGSVWACGKNIEHELGLADDHPALQPEQGSNERPKAVFQPVQVSPAVSVLFMY